MTANFGDAVGAHAGPSVKSRGKVVATPFADAVDSAIKGNHVNSTGAALGGGISGANSLLSLTNCTVNANQANGATALGGGIFALDSTVESQSCTVSANQANGTVLAEGGGVGGDGTNLTLVASTVKRSKATTGGTTSSSTGDLSSARPRRPPGGPRHNRETARREEQGRPPL